MTDVSPNDPAAVPVELERIRRSIDVGFTRTDGALSLLMQRHDATDRHLGNHDVQLAAQDARIDALERGETERQKTNDARIAGMEARRIPWRQLAAAAAVFGLLFTLWQAAPVA